jgi:hypothetical protein
MDKEYDPLIWNQTWELVPLPPDRKLVHCRWIYWTNMSLITFLIHSKASNKSVH